MATIKIAYNPGNEDEVKKVHDILMVYYENDVSQVEQKMNNNLILTDNQETWQLELKKKVDVHHDWTPGQWLTRGHTTKYNDKVYRIIQSHRAVTGSEPGVANSLFRPVPVIYPGETYPRWNSIGVLDSENNWDLGDRVTWQGQQWESDIDNNIYEPGVSSWTNITQGTGVDCTGVQEWDSSQAWNTYTVGDRRTNNGRLYELHTQAWAQAEPSGASGHLGWTDLGECNG